MATTSNTYTGNGSNKLFSITFPYLDTTDIDVYLNGTLQTVTTQYTFANATTVEFVTAPGAGATVLLNRSTNDTTLAATFFSGSSIRASDLNDNFDQVLYIAQETDNEATTATSTAATATTTANTALSQSAAAVSTANTASSNASAAVSTANTASTNASNAVTTANTASSNATTAINTANAATTTANTASSNASAAVSTANTASSNASTAVSTANSASSNASAAVTTANTALSTANTASTNATTAVNTANTASTNASSAVTTANTANTNATTAINAVSSVVAFPLVAAVANIPASPTNGQGVQVTNSTGIESFTPLSGKPVGFVGDAGINVKIQYTTTGNTWSWIGYAPNDSDARYLQKAGIALGSAGSPSLTFTGDTNTGIFSPGADQVAISTSGTGRLFVDSSGNVGIGSASPAASLDIAGNQIFTAANPQIQFNAGGPIIRLPSANTLAFLTDSTNERLRIDSSGNVGIGTSSPQSRLDLGGGSTAASQISWHDSSTTSYGNIWQSYNGARTTIGNGLKGSTTVFNGFESSTSNLWGRAATEWDYGVIKFYTDAASTVAYGTAITPTESARIDSSGRLLVGTSTSTNHIRLDQKLAVVSTGGTYGGLSATSYSGTAAGTAPIFDLQRSRGTTDGSMTAVASGDDLGFIAFRGSDGTNFINAAIIYTEVDGTPGTNDMPGRLVFSTTADGAASPTERFRIGSAGQLGIDGANYGTTGQSLISQGSSASPTWGSSVVSGTAVASTSGTSIDFTGIPSWVKRVTVVFYEVSTNGGSNVIVRLGTSSGVDTSSNYRGATDNQATGGGLATSFTNGLALERTAAASYSRQGLATFCRLASNSWVGTYLGSSSTGPSVAFGSTAITLSGTLDRVRITTVNGTDTFDAGSINILYE